MKIRIINKDINQEQFNKYSPIIATIVFNECEDLKIDQKLTIYLKDKPTRNGINGSCYSHKKKYYMDLYSSLFDRKDDELELVIFHELVHLKDLISIDSKKTKYKSYKHTYKNIDNILIRQGFNSWTEFNACASVNTFSNMYKSSHTMLGMSKKLEELLVYKDSIIENINNNNINVSNMINTYIDKVEDFIYFSMRCIAADPYRKYKYCDKTINKESFIILNNLYCKLSKLLTKMYHGTYGKYMIKRLSKIGVFLFKEVYLPLNICINKKRNRYNLAFFMDE